MSWTFDSFKLKTISASDAMRTIMDGDYIPFVYFSEYANAAKNDSNYPIRCIQTRYQNVNYDVDGTNYRGKYSLNSYTDYSLTNNHADGITFADLGVVKGGGAVELFRVRGSCGYDTIVTANVSTTNAITISSSFTGGVSQVNYAFTWQKTISNVDLSALKLHFRFLQADDIDWSRFDISNTNSSTVVFGVAISYNNAFQGYSSGGDNFHAWIAYDIQYIGMANGLLNELNIDGEYNSDEYGGSSTVGGYGGGTFDDTSDTISIPPMPSIGISTAGFTNVYKVSTGELIGFGAELFPKMPDFDTSATGIPEVLNNIGTAVQSLFTAFQNSKLIDYVIDCHIIPVSPTTGNTESINVAYKTFTQTAAKVTSDYVDIDCGSLNVGEYYANFMDYGQFTTAKLYLPFVGFVPIQPEYWQSGVLSVIYRFNIVDGSFVAFVKSTSSKSQLTDSVIAQYGGNCCVHLPVTGLNYANMVSGALQTVPAVINSAKGGDISGAASNALNTLSLAPSMQSSNGYNSCTAFLGVRTPYLIIERAVSNFSRNFPNENGLPSNITVNFDTLAGYTVATTEIMTGFSDATEDEKTMILNALAEGTIF